MSGNEVIEASGSEQEVSGDADENFEIATDDTSERAPLLMPDIQTLKITSPKRDRTKKCDVFDKLLQDNSNKTTNEPNRETEEQKIADNSDKNEASDTERQRSYTDPSRPLKWRLIGPYQDLRLSGCRRIYAKSGRKDDLALFFHNGRFYAMEAWCSHMGK